MTKVNKATKTPAEILTTKCTLELTKAQLLLLAEGIDNIYFEFEKAFPKKTKELQALRQTFKMLASASPGVKFTSFEDSD